MAVAPRGLVMTRSVLADDRRPVDYKFYFRSITIAPGSAAVLLYLGDCHSPIPVPLE